MKGYDILSLRLCLVNTAENSPTDETEKNLNYQKNNVGIFGSEEFHMMLVVPMKINEVAHNEFLKNVVHDQTFGACLVQQHL